jgi:hypothetical protein
MNTTGKKFGGRVKGTPNKVNTDFKEIITELLNNNIDNIQNDLDSLEPKDRLAFIERLFKYVVPSLSAAKIDTKKADMEEARLAIAAMFPTEEELEALTKDARQYR